MTANHDEKDWIFVADAHFSGRVHGEMESFLAFLDEEKDRIGCLFILGDLFEFLFGFRATEWKKGSSSSTSSFPFTEYLPVLEQLRDLYHQGVHIKYVEGNHDFFLRSFFSEHLGIDVDVYPERWEGPLGRKRVLVAHGDLSNPKQWKYRLFRRIIKNRITYRLIQWLGPDPTRSVARKLSERSHRQRHEVDPQHPRPTFKEFAHGKFKDGFEVVILAHSHLPEAMEEWIDGKRHLYFNVGDWMTHRSFLRYTPPEDFRLSRFG